MSSFKDLEFIRIYDVNLIPRHLWENMKGRDWKIENVYKYARMIGNNPLNLMYALADKEHRIRGVLWATVDPITELICVNALSVEKEFQHPIGDAITKSVEFLKKHIEDPVLCKALGVEKLRDKLLWTTTRPEAYKKWGAEEYHRTVMEI